MKEPFTTIQMLPFNCDLYKAATQRRESKAGKETLNETQKTSATYMKRN